jgi:DNA-binding SARP family transcriptional activator
MRRVLAIVVTVSIAVSIAFWLTRGGVGDGGDFVHLMNVGMGHVENRQSDKAIEVLTRAVRLRPRSAPALRNLARAHLIKKRAENYEAAVEALKTASEVEPKSASNSYLMGLALVGLERFAESVPYFEEAVRLDPNTAALRYQLADAYQKTENHEKAWEQLQETVRLEPTHTSAYYKLSSYARRRGDRNEVVRLTKEFARLKKLLGLQPPDILDRCVHTAPEPGSVSTRSDGPADEAIAIQWVDVTDDVFASETDRSATTAAVIEVDRLGRPTLFVVAADGRMSLMSMSDEGRFDRTDVFDASPDRTGFTGCAIGDFFVRIPPGSKKFSPRREARNDCLLIGPAGTMLLERTGETTFADRTSASGLADLTGSRARWVDFDHNGVLDLAVVGPDGLSLWQNNSYVIGIDEGNDTTANAAGDQPPDLKFVDVTRSVGLTLDGPASDVAAFDIDGNVATDLVVGRADQPTKVFMNQRAGKFSPMVEPPGPWPAATRIEADDLNNDGYTDVVLASGGQAMIIDGRTSDAHVLETDGVDVAGVLLVDYDNDGLLDVCVYGSAVKWWRNNGEGKWSAGAPVPSVAASVRDIVPADFDNDGDTDLLLLTADKRMRLFRNDGGNANGQMKIRLVSILTNPTGLGQHIEFRDGDKWITRYVSRIPIEIGVGKSSQFDTVHVLWTNGVVDNQFLVPTTQQPLEFVEKMVELGSCPFLFAWNGDRFDFVTDILGNSPLGLSIRRDEVLPADPNEIVYIGDAESMKPRDGQYVVEVAECYREVLYLDHASLIAVDHDANVEIHPTDKLMPAPFPRSELWALAERRSPITVASSDRVDRSDALQEIDGVFAPPGVTLPPPFRGMCHPLTLTVDFGVIDVDRPLVLALTGWLRYGSASVNIAISQNPSITVIPPTLEVETEPGAWAPVDVVVGMPAGKTKTILCDLSGKLPEGARRLRLTSTFEIRWDRIAMFDRIDLDDRKRHDLQPTSANLYFRGFPEMKPRGPHHPITPDYHTLAENPPWRTTPQGWCTRYGDVLDLATDADDRTVILNGGDALTLGYAAGDLPDAPAGMVRSFFFFSVGWEKDADHNVVGGDTVEPLPVGDADIDWQVQYNTRFVPRDTFNTTRERR